MWTCSRAGSKVSKSIELAGVAPARASNGHTKEAWTYSFGSVPVRGCEKQVAVAPPVPFVGVHFHCSAVEAHFEANLLALCPKLPLDLEQDLFKDVGVNET